MATTGFDTYYSDTPIPNLDKNQREWFHPIVDRIFRERSVFTGLVPFAYRLDAVNAKTMTISEVFGIHPNFDPVGLRDLWLPASHIDSRSVQVTFDRYAGKVAYMKYDDIITYWKQGGQQGQSALRSILNGALGDHMVDVNDYLIRNTFLSGAFANSASSASDPMNFGALTSTDTFVKEIADEMWLGFSYRGLAQAADPSLPMSNQGQILCITSPGGIFEFFGDEDWKSVKQYADPTSLLRYETGMWHNTRFLQTPRMVLYNCGEIIGQYVLDGAHSAEDGSPDPTTTPVDGVRRVGQDGAQHYILTTTDPVEVAIGDIISVHVDRTDSFGVDDGADYRDGTKIDRRVVGVDHAQKRIQLDRPLMTDFPTGAFVTKATHVHAAIFIGAPGGVVSGVGRPIELHTPPPVDDLEMMYRFSWDQYLGYNVYQPDVFETYFFTGKVKVKGAPVNQSAS